jgi:hypothetical protein
VTVAVAGAGRLTQPLDLSLSQVFPRPQLDIGLAPRRGDGAKNRLGAISCKCAFATDIGPYFLRLSLKWPFCAQLLERAVCLIVIMINEPF